MKVSYFDPYFLAKYLVLPPPPFFNPLYHFEATGGDEHPYPKPTETLEKQDIGFLRIIKIDPCFIFVNVCCVSYHVLFVHVLT